MKADELSTIQKRAAGLLARGHTNAQVAQKCDISARTVQRWKGSKAFQQAIEDYSQKAATAEFERLLERDDDEIERCQAVEREHLTRLDSLIEKLGCLSVDVLDSCEPDDVSPRALPALCKAFATLIECRRTGSDRILGLEAILDELVETEKIFSEKTTTA